MQNKVVVVVGATGGIGLALVPQTAANAIMFALSADPQAVPMEINIQPESHLFF